MREILWKSNFVTADDETVNNLVSTAPRKKAKDAYNEGINFRPVVITKATFENRLTKAHFNVCEVLTEDGYVVIFSEYVANSLKGIANSIGDSGRMSVGLYTTKFGQTGYKPDFWRANVNINLLRGDVSE